MTQTIDTMKNELKNMQNPLNPDYSESTWKDELVLGSGNVEQRRRSREAVVKIAVNFLQEMKKGELADVPQSSMMISFQKCIHLGQWNGHRFELKL